MTITFREATTDDLQVIADYNCRLANETEDKALPDDTVTNGVRRGMQQGDEVQYFVAEDNATIVGQIMLTREWSDWRDGWAVWIQSVYVRADYRGQGIFRRLFEHVKHMLEQQPDVIMIRLYVEQDNSTAMTAYEKLGFVDPGYRVMEMPIARANC